MKKFFSILMIAAIITACNSNDNPTEENGEEAVDTTEINPTNPATLNEAATHSQTIPRDSVEMSSDSTGNIRPGDTTQRR
jgi:PBP1b-binding outer membrane lipoprotein LpoB